MKKGNHFQQQDQRLIAWMSDDLDAGFSRVVEVYQKHLQQTAYGLLGDTPRLAHLVEDVVQDGFLNAYLYLQRHPEKLTPQFHLRAWLTKIVQRHVICRNY